MRPAAAASYLGVTKPTLYRWVRDGVLPPPRRLGANSTAFLRADLDDWLSARPPAYEVPEEGQGVAEG